MSHLLRIPHRQVPTVKTVVNLFPLRTTLLPAVNDGVSASLEAMKRRFFPKKLPVLSSDEGWRAVEVAAFRRNKELEAMGAAEPRYDGRYMGNGYHSATNGPRISVYSYWAFTSANQSKGAAFDRHKFSARVHQEYLRIREIEGVVYPALNRRLTREERALVPLLYLEL